MSVDDFINLYQEEWVRNFSCSKTLAQVCDELIPIPEKLIYINWCRQIRELEVKFYYKITDLKLMPTKTEKITGRKKKNYSNTKRSRALQLIV